MDLTKIWPPYAVLIRVGDLELSPVREADYPELGDCAAGGVRRDDVEAFLVPWDTGSDEEIARSLAQFHWKLRADFTPQNWNLEFAVRHCGRIVGVQGVKAENFALTRTMSTGSWLSRREQGRGLGTLMRSAVLSAFAEHFGALRFQSAYIVGNEASRKVSDKIGYRPNGVHTILAQSGSPVEEQQLIITSEELTAPPGLSVAGVDAFRRFIGLDSREPDER